MTASDRWGNQGRFRMADLEITRDEIHFGASVTLRFMRTLRIPGSRPDNTRQPHLGAFPLFQFEDYLEQLPDTWRASRGIFIPLREFEAMWISLSGRWWKPNAVKVRSGRIDAITGTPWTDDLRLNPRNYIVCPDQTSCDGVNLGGGAIGQFAAPSLADESAVNPRHPRNNVFDSIELVVFEPRAGCFPDRPPRGRVRGNDACGRPRQSEAAEANTVTSEQTARVPPATRDSIETWNPLHTTRVCVRLVNSAQFREITSQDPPPAPVSARDYADAALPPR